MKKLISVFITVFLLISLVSCGGSNSNSGKDNPDSSGDSGDGPIYVGVMDAFSGDKAMSGMYAKEAAEMFVTDINEKGGVLGRELVVVYEDDQGNETFATNAFQKITSDYDLSGIVLTKYSSVALAVEPFLDDTGVPAICSGSSQKIATTDSNYLYATRKAEEEAAVSYAKGCEAVGMTKVSILHCPDATGTGLAPLITKELESLGIEVLSVQQFGADEKNFAPYIAKMVADGSDGIVAIAQQTEAALIMTSVSEANLGIPHMGSSSFCQQTAISNAGKSANDWYSVTAWSPNISTEPAKSWVERYTKLYDHAPDMGSTLTYDALSIFCEAIEKCGSADPEKVNEEIRKMQEFAGIASVYSYSEGSSMLATTEFLVQIQDEKSIIIDTLK